MKKPYIKEYEKFSRFKVWIVDGAWVRDKIDEEFTNFGQHYRFKFIPKNEFWIDKEGSGNELRYYIDHLIVEHRLMKEGKKYQVALEKADRIEKRERSKSELMKKNRIFRYKKELIDKVHKELLKKYSKENIKIWRVDGELVRDIFYIDFTEGGHDRVYPFIPFGEIWIDDDLSDKEVKYILVHELYERNLLLKNSLLKMKGSSIIKNKDYDKVYSPAHMAASKLENFYRKNPKNLDKRIKEELMKVKSNFKA